MLAYTYVEQGKFALLDKPKPVLQNDRDAIVRVTRSTICTSDLHIRNGAVPRARPGVVLGQRYTPVERVGICVPGSPVAFPSTILMNVIPARIAKTLSFLVEGKCVLIVAAGDAKVDNSKYKGLFHTKAKMLTPDQAVEMTSHAVGGVCPFAVNEGVKVYLDDSLKRFETVFPAAGSSNSMIELTIPELERYSNSCGWVDVCKNWRENG